MPTPSINWYRFSQHPRVKVSLWAHALILALSGIGWALGWQSLSLFIVLLIPLFHLAVCLAALWPRSQWLGPNLVRLNAGAQARREVALSFDDGPNETLTPAVLDLLDQYQCKASFFVIAQKLKDPIHARWAKAILARGHCLENHSWSHPWSFAFRGLAGLQSEIDQAQELISQFSGQNPRYFRAPAGIRNPLLQPLLELKGMQLASWTRRGFDTRDKNTASVTQRLLKNLQAGDILLFHDGHCASNSEGRPVMLLALESVLKQLKIQGLRGIALPTSTNEKVTR
jgi:peptidoglycan-N-acetylglucosamine deacetylase